MKRLILFIGFIALLAKASAIDPQALVKEGNDFYTKNNFEEAIKKYQAVISSGYVSPELYFNLGNSYYKSKNIKSAILYYERAKLLDPGDKDVEFNLEMARALTVDKIEAVSELFFISWYKWLRSCFSTNIWGGISAVLFILSLMAFLFYLQSDKVGQKKFGFWFAVIAFVVSATSFTMAAQLKDIQTADNTAIIFVPTVTVKSSPADSGTNLFVLHEGSKVEILDQVGEWREIRIADGNRGWIRISNLEII
ncbi:MAG: tetratricopeptide repeat protein [Bacteroidota bacterium]|nr:tetratricopeptide repeat protein [Bacteroidota bacterium]